MVDTVKGQTAVSERHEWTLFAEAAASARRTGRDRVVSVSFAAPKFDPVDVFARARARGAEAMLWQLPSEDVALVGVGAAAEFVGDGPERFAQVRRQWRRLVDGTLSAVLEEGPDGAAGAAPEQAGDTEAGVAAAGADPRHPGPGPLAMGGFAFTPGSATGAWTGFGDGRLVLPRAVLGRASDRRWLTLNTVVGPATDPAQALVALLEYKGQLLAELSESEDGPGPRHTGNGEKSGRDAGREPGGNIGTVSRVEARDDLPKEQWLAAIARVAGDIRAGKLEKAVLARCVRVSLSESFSVAAALRRLQRDYPETYVFAVAGHEGCFFGATPERIVHLAEGRVNVACMAGSIGRGATEAEDRQLGEQLLADAKNVEEHKVVLRSILSGLAPACDEVVSDDGPGLRKFANVQHLYTPVRARAKDGVDVLELVSRVHPTPAIGGHPTKTALELIAKEEGMDRGWYAGPVGWMNERGEGEFAVGLRSGLVRDGEARLFAGCGIMGDSDPESEYAESVLKLRPMLRAVDAGMLAVDADTLAADAGVLAADAGVLAADGGADARVLDGRLLEAEAK